MHPIDWIIGSVNGVFEIIMFCKMFVVGTSMENSTDLCKSPVGSSGDVKVIDSFVK